MHVSRNVTTLWANNGLNSVDGCGVEFRKLAPRFLQKSKSSFSFFVVKSNRELDAI